MAWQRFHSLLSFMLRYPELLLAIICFFVVHYVKTKRPRLPVNWPVVGMVPYLFMHAGNLHDWCTEVLRESGCTFIFKGPWGVRGDLLLTCDPANVNHVFNVNFTNYPKGGEFSEIFDILGDGIFNADNDSWKFQRRKAHALISDRRFRSFVGKVSNDKLVEGLFPVLLNFAHSGEAFDLQDVFLRLTFDVTCKLVLGIDPRCLAVGLPTVPFAKAMDDAEEALFFRHVTRPSWKWIRKSRESKLASARRTIDHFMDEYISQKIHEKDGRRLENLDLLSSYLECEEEVHELGFEFRKFLRDSTLNLLIAGRDTTSSALTWFFWLVAKNPKVEEKILLELKERSFHLNNTDLGCLKYLHASLLESLRLYPPVPFEHKGVRRREMLPSGVEVSRRRMILFSLYAMGRMEAIWGMDYKEFMPERWISETGKIKHEPAYKFLVFNCGPRTCLGKDMAFTQMKAVAAAFLYNFHVEVVKGHVAKPKLSIILHMKDGLMVRIRKRNAL